MRFHYLGIVTWHRYRRFVQALLAAIFFSLAPHYSWFFLFCP